MWISDPKIIGEYLRLNSSLVLDLVGDAQKIIDQVPPLPSRIRLMLGPAPVKARIAYESGTQNELFDGFPSSGSFQAVILDHIQDPQNLGAIIRSCAFFGVGTVIIPQKRACPITETVVSIARGGLATVRVYQVGSLRSVAERMKGDGFTAFGGDLDGVDPSSCVGGFGTNRWFLILGSEGAGLSRGLSELVDQRLAIARRGETIDSLNVSVAAGILLSHLIR